MDSKEFLLPVHLHVTWTVNWEILGHELAGLIERALNQVRRGKGILPSSLGMSLGLECQGQG